MRNAEVKKSWEASRLIRSTHSSPKSLQILPVLGMSAAVAGILAQHNSSDPTRKTDMGADLRHLWSDEQIEEALQKFREEDPDIYEVALICSPTRDALLLTLVSGGYLPQGPAD